MRGAASVFAVCALAIAGTAADPKKPGADAPAPSPVAATVNGEAIRLDEVDAQIRRRPLGGPLSAAQAKALRTAVAQDMIDDLLVRQYLRTRGPKVDPAEVEKHMAALAAAQRQQGKTVADFFKETGQTEAQAREAWTAILQFHKLIDAEATPDRLRKYYEAYKEHFDRVEVRVAHVALRVGADAPAGEKAAAREKLRLIKSEIAAGKVTFADAARKYSICPTAQAGGDLGYITRKDGVTDEAVARAAFALKVGEVSDPIETEYGLRLVTATARKPGTPSKFENCIEDVRDCYADDVRQALIGKLRREAKITLSIP